MQKLRAAAILALFLSLSLCSGCGEGAANNANAAASSQPASNSEANAVKTNAEELGVLVNVPFEAEDVRFREFPAQKKIIAVLRFSPADSARIVADAEKLQASGEITIQSESWFQEELIAQSDMSGDDTLRARSYSAAAFLLPPYTEGHISRIEGTDYFVLEASIK